MSVVCKDAVFQFAFTQLLIAAGDLMAHMRLSFRAPEDVLAFINANVPQDTLGEFNKIVGPISTANIKTLTGSLKAATPRRLTALGGGQTPRSDSPKLTNPKYKALGFIPANAARTDVATFGYEMSLVLGALSVLSNVLTALIMYSSGLPGRAEASKLFALFAGTSVLGLLGDEMGYRGDSGGLRVMHQLGSQAIAAHIMLLAFGILGLYGTAK